MTDETPHYLEVFATSECTVEGMTEKRTTKTKIGVAFPHKQGGGFSIRLVDGITISGNLVVLPPQEPPSRWRRPL